MKLLTKKETNAIMNDLATLGDILVDRVCSGDFGIGVSALNKIALKIGGLYDACEILNRMGERLIRNQELENERLSETGRDVEEV